MMCATIPAALLMTRIGRPGGFWVGSAIGASGGVTAGLALWAASFSLFCAEPDKIRNVPVNQRNTRSETGSLQTDPPAPLW